MTIRLRQPSPQHTAITGSRPAWYFVMPALFFVFLLALPLAALVWWTARGDVFTLVLSETAITALWLSMVTSLITVFVSLIAGTPLAYILARWEFPGRKAIEMLVDLPVVLPPSVAGLALLIAFGRQGLLGGWLGVLGIQLPFTTAAVVVAQVFVSAPLFIRAARIGFAAIEPQLEEAAHVEGANPWQVFGAVMLPLAARALTSGAILAWTRALGEFGATILFAGNLQGVTQTMPLAIYLGFERNLDMAVALSVELVIVSLIMLGVMSRLDGKQEM